MVTLNVHDVVKIIYKKLDHGNSVWTDISFVGPDGRQILSVSAFGMGEHPSVEPHEIVAALATLAPNPNPTP